MRRILHSDLNNFYASCECLFHPEYEGLPLVVCGKVEDRHGVVLAKNLIAKTGGIKTGMTVYECKKIFPNLITVVANHELYAEYSKKVKDLYKEYTDRIESFGIDEAWLDISAIAKDFTEAEKIANEIRVRVKYEIGLTVSVGVSFNKVFAKLGSDMKKPDAVTTITPQNYKQLIWKLPVQELLYVGKSTNKKLNDLGISTIGGLANFDVSILKSKLGKPGEKLWSYANGLDYEEVKKYTYEEDAKSVGNSLTFYRDLFDIEEVEMLFYYLAESVSERMKKGGLMYAKTLHISVIDKELEHYAFQCQLPVSTSASNILAETAINLFCQHIDVKIGIRGVGLSVSNFMSSEQLALGPAQNNKEKFVALDTTMEQLRGRFGKSIINRALIMKDEKLQTRDNSSDSINSKKVPD